jgi:hypothetical protein
MVVAEVPMLEGEGEALFVEKFVVELVLCGGWGEDEAEVVGVLVLVGFVSFLSFDEDDVFELEKEERESFEVVGEGGG